MEEEYLNSSWEGNQGENKDSENVCMCVCVCVRMHACVCVHACACTSMYALTCTHVCDGGGEPNGKGCRRQWNKRHISASLSEEG